MHMKGHIRDLFLETIDERGPHYGGPSKLPDLDDVVGIEEGGGKPKRVVTWSRLLGKLWNCTDCVPGDVCEDLGFERGSTYAQIVRTLKAYQEVPALLASE